MTQDLRNAGSLEKVNSLVNWKETVAYVANCEEKIRKEGLSQVDRIDAYIKQLVKRREQVYKSEEILRYWRLQHSALSTSRWVKELKCDELQKREIDRRAEVSERINLDQVKQAELREFRGRNEQRWSKQCGRFHAACKDYGFKFHKAQLEYSPVNLARDIQLYQEEIERINEELKLLQKKIDDMKEEFDLSCKTTSDIENVSKAHIILKLDNEKKLRNIRSRKDKLVELQAKIKQRKLELDTYKKK